MEETHSQTNTTEEVVRFLLEKLDTDITMVIKEQKTHIVWLVNALKETPEGSKKVAEYERWKTKREGIKYGGTI